MFITFLISTAFFSVFSHTILNLNSITPIVGASGIVSGLMGAYVYLFPNAKLLVLVPLGFLFPTTIKAKYFMIFWFVSQVFIFGTQNISWEAHLGGFVFGYVILRLFNYRRYRSNKLSSTLLAKVSGRKLLIPLLQGLRLHLFCYQTIHQYLLYLQ